MLKALRVSTMLLVLAGSAHAGEVLTPPVAPPPPTTNVQSPDSNIIVPNSLVQAVVAVIVSVLP